MNAFEMMVEGVIGLLGKLLDIMKEFFTFKSESDKVGFTVAMLVFMVAVTFILCIYNFNIAQLNIRPSSPNYPKTYNVKFLSINEISIEIK